MTDDAKCYAATPAATLEQHITDSNVAKNEAEWWAYHEIRRLREENARLLAANKDLQLHFDVVIEDLKEVEEENARLREAVRPFAALAKEHSDFKPDFHHVDGVSLGHLRAAAAAIREGGKDV